MVGTDGARLPSGRFESDWSGPSLIGAVETLPGAPGVVITVIVDVRGRLESKRVAERLGLARLTNLVEVPRVGAELILELTRRRSPVRAASGRDAAPGRGHGRSRGGALDRSPARAQPTDARRGKCPAPARAAARCGRSRCRPVGAALGGPGRGVEAIRHRLGPAVVTDVQDEVAVSGIALAVDHRLVGGASLEVVDADQRHAVGLGACPPALGHRVAAPRAEPEKREALQGSSDSRAGRPPSPNSRARPDSASCAGWGPGPPRGSRRRAPPGYCLRSGAAGSRPWYAPPGMSGEVHRLTDARVRHASFGTRDAGNQRAGADTDADPDRHPFRGAPAPG